MPEKIKFRCPCGKKLSVPIERAGKKAQCPVCEKVLRAPKLDAAETKPDRVRLGAEELESESPPAGDALAPAESEVSGEEQLLCDKCGKPIPVPEGSIPRVLKCRSCFHMMPAPPGFGAEKTSAARLFAAHVGDPKQRAKKDDEGSDFAVAYIECDACGKEIAVPRGAVAKVMKCKSCFHMVPVPVELLRTEEARSDVVKTAGSILKTMSTDIICTCAKCNTRFVIGVNARVAEIGRSKTDAGPAAGAQAAAKRPPDLIELLPGEESWPEGKNPPEPMHEVPDRIKYAREQQEYRKWRCGECKHVQQYVW